MKKNISPFWKTKTLAEMTRAEWESLCDGCGRCCLEKLENKKTGKVHFTSVSCKYLDIKECRCTCYQTRKKTAPWCMVLTPEMIPKIRWLPKNCAYRVVFEGRNLPWWHPLVSGSHGTIHRAGISVSAKVISSEHVHPDDLINYIVDWKVWKNLGSELNKKPNANPYLDQT